MNNLPNEIINILFSYIPTKDAMTSIHEVCWSLLRLGMVSKRFYKLMPSIEKYKSLVESEKKNFISIQVGLKKYGLTKEDVSGLPFHVKQDTFMNNTIYYSDYQLKDISIKKYKSYYSFLLLKESESLQKQIKKQDEDFKKEAIEENRKRIIIRLVEKYQLNIILKYTQFEECVAIMKTIKKYIHSRIFLSEDMESNTYESALSIRLIKEINYYVWCHKRRLILADTLQKEDIHYDDFNNYEFIRNEVERYVFNEIYSIEDVLKICRLTHHKINLIYGIIKKCGWNSLKHSRLISSYINNQEDDQKKIFRDAFQQIFEIEFFETYTNYKKIYRNILKNNGPMKCHYVIDQTAKKQAFTEFITNQSLQVFFTGFLEKHSKFIRIVMDNLGKKYIDDYEIPNVVGNH